MRRFAISVAAVALAGTLSSIPAVADYNYGPVQNAGQCWKPAGSGSTKDFGYWGACPQAASAPAARSPRRQRHH